MFPTYNHANIRTDVDGMAFLDLEIQVLFNNQKVLFRYTLPATSNFKSCNHLANNIGEDIKPDKSRLVQINNPFEDKSHRFKS